MSQILTNALATYKAQQEAAEEPIVLDQIVFAYVPGIDPEADIDPETTLPDESFIVYRYDIPEENKGFINPNAVVYSCLLGSDIGTWTYNSIYLINSELNLAASIITTLDQTKVASDPTNGIEGDTLVRNIVTTYSNAQDLTGINVAAETWQLDFTSRLSAIDERIRQVNLDEYGHAAFFEDGWKVTHTSAATSATVSPGVGYVGGLKSVLDSAQTLNLTGITLPKTVYLVSTFQGQANSAWETLSELRVLDALDDTFTEDGNIYYSAPLALLSSSADAEDLRTMNKETDFVHKSNAATNADIDAESTAIKHINLPQLWRAFTNKLAALKAEDDPFPQYLHNDEAATNAQAIEGSNAGVWMSALRSMEQLKSRISSSLTGTRTDYSASESALNQVNTKAVNAQSTADSAQGTADAAIPQVGGSTITTQDWNTLTSPGAYAVGDASGNNRPPAYPYGTLFVLNTKTTIVQLYHTDTAGQILMRTKYSTNIWGEWAHIGGVSQSPNSAMRLGDSNLNTFDGSASYTTAQFGFFYQDVSAKATAENNYPEQEPGTLIVAKSAMTGGAGCIQTYITRSNNIYTRSKYVTWTEWVKVYSTKNKPTPDDVGALTGQTVVSSFKNPRSWLKIATAYLPSSSSVAKIEVYGGNGFNSGLDYQSTRHQIIVRAGNTQGTGNCRLYTESSRGCPFDGVGFVHTGDSQFDIYAKSKTAYSVNVLVEYASTHGITPKNEAATETPTNLYEGDVVEDYNSFNPPTLANIGIEHIGKSVVGNEADEESIDIAGTSYYLTKYVTSYDPNSLIINSTATTGITEIKHDGYYLLRYTVNRLRPSDGATIQNGYIEINGDFVAQNKAVSNNYATAAIVTEYYGALLAGDLIRYLTQGSSLAEGGSFSIEYKRALSEAERLLVQPQRAQDVKQVAALKERESRVRK
ncbi:phage tail-collar fiber domain-containing protein [Vibrio parahaemolyticus]|uniref:phage tail-collar fiber domain-containing protein n=1 Tax=Vibrio parahaemolyticus TaxID=670 RepID=UPI0015E0C3AD|nr:phage tail protein [Vibrio parahaemolyticus]